MLISLRVGHFASADNIKLENTQDLGAFDGGGEGGRSGKTTKTELLILFNIHLSRFTRSVCRKEKTRFRNEAKF